MSPPAKRRQLWDNGRPVKSRQGAQPYKVSNLPVERRPIGRPSDYREHYAVTAYKLRLAGLSIERIADIFEHNPSVLARWLVEVPEFRVAWEKGGELADANVANGLYSRAIGYSHKAEKVFPSTKDRGIERIEYVEHYPPDVGAARTWLFNRQPDLWKNVNVQEMTGPNGQSLVPPTIVVNPVQAVQVNVNKITRQDDDA